MSTVNAHAEEIATCDTCSTVSDFELSALSYGYNLAGGLPAGTYYPWIYVVNFNTGTIKRFEVEIIVNSDSNNYLPSIPDATVSLVAQLVVESSLQQAVQDAEKIFYTLDNVGILYPKIYYFFGADNAFDFLGNQNGYNDLASAWRSQLQASNGLNYAVGWTAAMASQFLGFLAPLDFIATVEFADGSFIDFFAIPQFDSNGEVFTFEFEFKKAVDADGNEVFEDPDTYANETFYTDLGNWGGTPPTPGQLPLTSYLESIGWDVEVHDGRGSFGCLTVAVTVCSYGPDMARKCDTELRCK